MVEDSRNPANPATKGKGNSVKVDGSINGARDKRNSSRVTSEERGYSRSSCSDSSKPFPWKDSKALRLQTKPERSRLSTAKPLPADVKTVPSPAGSQHTKRVEWSDLTEDQRAFLNDFRKNGINLTPEQILKIASGEIEYHHPPKSLDDEIAAIHVDIEKGDGSRVPVLEGRRIEVGLGRKNKPNLDFVTIWKQKDMSAAVSLRKGYVSLAAHGGVHYVKQELRSYDVESLLAALIGTYYAGKGRLPKDMKFTKKIRERAAAMYELVAIAKANQVQTVHRRSTGEDS